MKEHFNFLKDWERYLALQLLKNVNKEIDIKNKNVQLWCKMRRKNIQ